MAEKKEFNALKGLEGFDATESKPMRSGKNALEIGKTYIFIDAGELGRWGLDKDNKPLEYPMVRTNDENGILCNAPYIASCMFSGEGVILNEDMPPEFHCVITPRIVKEDGLKGFDFVQNHVKEGSVTFPKLKVVDTLPVAIKRVDLLKNAHKETKLLYQQELGTPLDKLTCEFVPSYRKSKYSAGKSVYSLKTSIVEFPE